MELQEVVDSYMEKVPELKWYCQRCLETRRWNGSVVLMIVDASFTSIGLNYFIAVVPKVDKFRKTFVEAGKIKNLEDLATINPQDQELKRIWKNKRSWQVAKSVATYLAKLKAALNFDDRQALIYWAKNSELEEWDENPIGKLNGIGINTFQYLRMMGGVDTVMPDKIVKRVIEEILIQAGIEMPSSDIKFVKLVDYIARETGYKAIELCWMTWMIQSEAGISRMEKYSDLLPRI
jgi:hypothetical protein